MAAIKCLVVGLGIGQLYKNVCKDLKYICYTVDINPDLNPNYLDLDQAITDVNSIDITIVSVPNYLHYSIAKKVAKVSKIVLIEKPGVKDAQEWQSLVREFPNTRFMMIKNNQYRDNTKLLFAKYHKSKNIKLHWINNNRVPKPGSWFTNSQLSYGGVSKDLLPHLLSFYTLFEPQYQQTNWHNKIKTQKWQLQDLTDSDYGDIKVDGIYNVDDYVTLNTNIFNKDITITTDWRSMSGSDIGLYFDNEFIDLGLCPESAYKNMLKFVNANIYNDIFWQNQLEQDIWIHKQIA
jgi:hypothetical protein